MASATPTTATGFDWSARLAIEDGTSRSVRDILQDSVLANALSDEGAIRPCLPAGAPPAGDGVLRAGDLIQGLAAAKSEMIVGVAVLVHHSAPVPVRRTPPAPVFMRSELVEDKPAALHLRVA